MKYKKIAVFSGASKNIIPLYQEPMRQIGELLAKNKITMIFGIGDNGLMGSSFQGVRNKNGKVLGITTKHLLELQCSDPSIFKKGEIELATDLSDRKYRMFEKCDAVLVGPGGWGTLDEAAEFATLVQVGEIKKKPMVFLNFSNFWGPFKTLIFNMLQDGMLSQNKVDFIDFIDNPEDVFTVLEKVQSRLNLRSFE